MTDDDNLDKGVVLRFVPRDRCPFEYRDRAWVAYLCVKNHLPPELLVIRYLCYDPRWSDDEKLKGILHDILVKPIVAVDLINLDRTVAELIASDQRTADIPFFLTEMKDSKTIKIEKRISLSPLKWQDLGSPQNKTESYGPDGLELIQSKPDRGGGKR
jgi:hypothetical protein